MKRRANYTVEAAYEGDYIRQQTAGVPIKYNQVEMMRIADGEDRRMVG